MIIDGQYATSTPSSEYAMVGAVLVGPHDVGRAVPMERPVPLGEDDVDPRAGAGPEPVRSQSMVQVPVDRNRVPRSPSPRCALAAWICCSTPSP